MPSDGEAQGKIVLREDTLCGKELDVLHTITKLTHVLLDKRVLSKGAVQGAVQVAPPDQVQVDFARKSLYK